MVQEIVDIKTIKEIGKIFEKVSLFITKLKNESKYAEYIQYPKIPSGLSESMIIHLIKKKLILNSLDNYEITLGGRISDIVAKNSKKTIKIEVKATGGKGFQMFGPKDINADYLIWIHFGNLLRQNTFEGIQVFTISNPKLYFKKERRIGLKTMKEIVGTNLELYLTKNSDF